MSRWSEVFRVHLANNGARLLGCRAVVYRVTPARRAYRLRWPNRLVLVLIFFGASLGPSGASPYQLLDVFTCVDVEGNDHRLFSARRRLFQVGQHSECGTAQLREIVRQHQIDSTRAQACARDRG